MTDTMGWRDISHGFEEFAHTMGWRDISHATEQADGAAMLPTTEPCDPPGHAATELFPPQPQPHAITRSQTVSSSAGHVRTPLPITDEDLAGLEQVLKSQGAAELVGVNEFILVDFVAMLERLAF